ncbi:MAG TPA: hypothetical protein VGD12_18025 [Blastococcus sp.]|jgi:hypothetical protein
MAPVDIADTWTPSTPVPGGLSCALPTRDAAGRVAAPVARPLRYTGGPGARAVPSSSTETDKAVIDAMTSPYLASRL